MPAPKCTALVTGKHRRDSAKALCPACSPKTVGRSMPVIISGPPPTATRTRQPTRWEDPGSPLAQEARRTTSAANLHEIALIGDGTAVEAVARSPHADERTLRMIFEAHPTSQVYHVALAANPRTPGAELEAIRGHAEALRKREEVIAGHDDTIGGDQEMPAREHATEVMLHIADNANAWPSTLTALTRYPNSDVVKRAVRNPRTPGEVAQRFLNSADTNIQKGAARNPNLAVEDAEAAAADKLAIVRRQAAKLSVLQYDTYIRLAQDTSHTVLGNVAKNRKAPLAAHVLVFKNPNKGYWTQDAYKSFMKVAPVALDIDPDNWTALDYILDKCDGATPIDQDNFHVKIAKTIHR